MSKVLVTILNEVLDEITEEMRTTQATIEEHKAKVQDVQEELQQATRQQESALYEYGHAQQRSEALRTYLNRLGEYPRILGGKLKKLLDAQDRAAHSRDEVDGYLVRARTDLQGGHRDLAMAERHAAELQKSWDGVAALLARFQRTS